MVTKKYALYLLFLPFVLFRQVLTIRKMDIKPKRANTGAVTYNRVLIKEKKIVDII